MKRGLILLLILVLAVPIIYVIYLASPHRDKAAPFLQYYPAGDSLEVINGSSAFYFERLEAEILEDTVAIQVYIKYPLILLRPEKYDSFENAHSRCIILPENVQYLRWENQLIHLDSLVRE